MGRKDASVHIITNQQDKIITRLLIYYEQNPDSDEKALKAAQMVGNVDLIRFAMRAQKLPFNQVVLLQSPGRVSVYDPTLTFETIEQSARELSEIFEAPIVYISNFDDDILLFGLICSGEIITSGIMGNGLSVYGIEHVDIDVQKFAAGVGIGDEQFCKTVGGSNDIEIVEKEFMRILGVPLKLTEEMVAEQSEYVQLKEQKGVLACKKESNENIF